TGRSSVICVISDFQRTACERIANAKIPQNIQLKMLPAGEPELANLAVRGLSLSPAGSATVQVSNFSHRDAREVKMDLVIDGKSSVVPSINVAARAVRQLVAPLADHPHRRRPAAARGPPGPGVSTRQAR